jgi:serine/threonine protein kinase
MYDNSYIVLEYCALGSLLHQLKSEHALTQQDLIIIIFEAAKGMEYLEKKHVVHSDLGNGGLMIALLC